jgi:hypothetical protein
MWTEACQHSATVIDIMHERTSDPTSPVSSQTEDNAKRASLLILQGRLSDAQAALSSKGVWADNEVTMEALKVLHPHSDSLPRTSEGPPVVALQLTAADEEELVKVMTSFKRGSSGGPDGWLTDWYHELLEIPVQHNRNIYLSLYMNFLNLALRGALPKELAPFLASARLIPLVKHNDPMKPRPINIGCADARVLEKLLNRNSNKRLSATRFQPYQYGIGVPNGGEATIHALNYMMESLDWSADYIIAQIDLTNG